MARNNNDRFDRQQPTSARIREAIAAGLDAVAVFTHLADLYKLALIAHLGAYGLHLLGDGLPRTPAAGMLILLDTASMSTHLLGLHEPSLILHLSGCALRLLLHPRISAAIRAMATCLAHHTARTTHNAGRVLASTWRRIRNRLRRNR